MIVTSKISKKQYFWVKVPRTGTHAYEKLFFPEFNNPNTKVIHLHTPYFSLKEASCENKPQVECGFTVVRNPYSRFISALQYLEWKRNSKNDLNDIETFLSICEFCGKKITIHKQKFLNSLGRNFINFLENEKVFYDFVYSHFDKNCILKTGYTTNEIFQTDNPTLIQSMFKPQTFFAYHPKVKFFKYENLQEFNLWINDTLGISTSTLGRFNSSSHINLNIDFTTKKFKNLVQYLFHDDFKLFGYDT